MRMRNEVASGSNRRGPTMWIVGFALALGAYGGSPAGVSDADGDPDGLLKKARRAF
jgi:hypothetical protein